MLGHILFLLFVNCFKLRLKILQPLLVSNRQGGIRRELLYLLLDICLN